uniref:Semaphorin 4D n=1 Tax=Erpetoichthys calabaricus TaxID=27687 RepID=A0A8C4XCQ2_ERPCA
MDACRAAWELWSHRAELNLLEFKEPDILNYSSFLLDEDKKTLYVGAREIILELDIENITVKKKQVLWKVPETVQSECVGKHKSMETDCRNYIRVLQKMNASHLYVCGTYAYRPSCDYLVSILNDFKLENNIEDGKGKCPYNPSKSFASVMVDGELYSGTESNFLGSQYVIYRSSSTNKIITYYAPAWLKEPRFVHADVIRESVNSANGDDDKIYFFFTEVNVELPQDLTKFFIPRIARVCKHDMGGRIVLQDRWTSFLKAKLVCWVPELNIVFDEVLDVLILKAPNWKDTVIYALFRSHWDYSMDSAVCKYKMSTVDEVFSRGTHMEEVIVLNMYQSWFRRQETFSSPRPGECINDNIRNNNIQSSKDLPSVILEFLKKSPMIHDSVLPVGNRPQMVFKNMNYTQIAVDQVRALDSRTYDIIFISTEDGNVHKTVVIDSKWHIIEEIQLLPNPEPIKELLLSSGQKKSLYAGSDERLVQSPVEFCEKHQSCVDCILARDPYCAWSTDAINYTPAIWLYDMYEGCFISFETRSLAVIGGGRNFFLLFYNPFTSSNTFLAHPATDGDEKKSSKWGPKGCHPPLKARCQRSAKRTMFAVFFGYKKMIASVPRPERTTMNSDVYTTLCLPEVFKNLTRGRPNRTLKNFILHHDNAPPHKSNKTVEFLAKSGIEVLHPPPYSPDLAPCDVWLFPTVKKELKGMDFEDRDSLISVVEGQLDQLTEPDLRHCFDRWIYRMKKCIEIGGEYVKQH